MVPVSTILLSKILRMIFLQCHAPGETVGRSRRASLPKLHAAVLDQVASGQDTQQSPSTAPSDQASACVPMCINVSPTWLSKRAQTTGFKNKTCFSLLGHLRPHTLPQRRLPSAGRSSGMRFHSWRHWNPRSRTQLSFLAKSWCCGGTPAAHGSALRTAAHTARLLCQVRCKS